MDQLKDLTEVYDAISFGFANELELAMDKVPLERLDTETEKSVFVCLIKAAQTSPLGLKAVKIIMERWRRGDIDGNLPETPVYFLMQPDIPQDIFDTMVQALDNWEYFYFVFELIHQDSSPEVQMALHRLDRAYGAQDPDIYRVLLAEIKRQRREEESYNHVVKEHLESLLEEVANYVARPPWIVSYYEDPIPDENDPEVHIPDDLSMENILPTAQEAAEMVIKKFGTIQLPTLALENPEVVKALAEEPEPPKPPKKASPIQHQNIPVILSPTPKRLREVQIPPGLCPILTEEQREAMDVAQESIKDAFIIAYNSATLQQKAQILGDLVHELSEEVLDKDAFLFSILGPANPIYGMPLDPESPCCKYGGCRMLTCIDFENEDAFGVLEEEDPQSIEWFRGACEVCHNKIAKKIYALRRPLTFGGWKGTFCSFECLRSAVPMNDVLNHFIINAIEQQLEEIGIQDRLVNGEGEINNEALQDKLEEETKDHVDGDLPRARVETIPESLVRNYM